MMQPIFYHLTLSVWVFIKLNYSRNTTAHANYQRFLERDQRSKMCALIRIRSSSYCREIREIKYKSEMKLNPFQKFCQNRKFRLRIQTRVTITEKCLLRVVSKPNAHFRRTFLGCVRTDFFLGTSSFCSHSVFWSNISLENCQDLSPSMSP